ncbi:hypothetical protein BDV19DRAFT_391217 [Aspergillus venezuelensis]
MQSTENEPAPGAYIAAAVARILQEAGIANILWGWTALGFVGNISLQRFPEVDFVIPAAQLKKAKEALVANKLHSLHRPSGVVYPIPAEHFHKEGALISLHSKQNILPWLTDYSAGPPPPNDPHLTMTDSNQLPPPNEEGCIGPSGP